MHKFGPSIARALRPLARSRVSNGRWIRVTASVAFAGAVVSWAAPATLLDDGESSRDHSGVHNLTPSQVSTDDSAQRERIWRKAYANAKKDHTAAREATFAEAEDFLGQTGWNCEGLGKLPLDGHMAFILKEMSIEPDDAQLWTMKKPSTRDSPQQPIRAVYLAMNANPDVMENHLVTTAALQFELDKWRKSGKLGPDAMIMAVIQYRDLRVELEYKTDGRFTPVLRHPISGKRLPFDPLERVLIKIQENGRPLLIHETAEYAIVDPEVIGEP